MDAQGNTFALSSYADTSVLLVFLRYAGCPWCNLTIHRLALEYPLLEKSGCQVVAVVQSTPANIQKHIYDRHQVRPQFPILPDTDRHIYDLYDVQPSLQAAGRSISDVPFWLQAVFKHGFRQTDADGNLLMVPAMFLIAPGSQEVMLAEYGTSFYEHLTFTSVYEALTFDVR